MTNAGMGGDKIGHGSQGHYGQNKMEKQMVSVSDVYCAIKMQFIDRGTIKATAPRPRRENQNADVGSFLSTELQGDISLGKRQYEYYGIDKSSVEMILY